MTFAPPSRPPPGWYDDPWGLAPRRWWDGTAWSWQVQGLPPPPRPAPPTVPIEAGLWGLVAITVLLVGIGVGASFVAALLPVVPAVVLVTVALYGPLAAYCVYASRRWATGRMSVDFGARFRPVDLAIGLGAAIAALQAERLVFAAVQAIGIPVASNTDNLRHDDRGLYLTLAAVAVVAAPLVEELFFRGLLLSALRSRLSAVPAVGLQALLFGTYHAAPVYGWGNFGLVLILAGVGAVFGTTAQLTRRLGGGMVAHAILNAAVFLVLLAS